MKNDFFESSFVKTFALSLLIVSFAFLLIVGGIILFSIYAAKKSGEFITSIPLSYTLAYGTIGVAITYIKNKYKVKE